MSNDPIIEDTGVYVEFEFSSPTMEIKKPSSTFFIPVKYNPIRYADRVAIYHALNPDAFDPANEEPIIWVPIETIDCNFEKDSK